MMTEQMRSALNFYRGNGYSNKTAAYLQAGYSDCGGDSDKQTNKARELFKKPQMASELSVMRKEDYDNSTEERKRVYADLADVQERCKAANDRGNELRALELQGKAFAMWVDRVHESTDTRSQDELIDLMVEGMRGALENMGITITNEQLTTALRAADTATKH